MELLAARAPHAAPPQRGRSAAWVSYSYTLHDASRYTYSGPRLVGSAAFKRIRSTRVASDSFDPKG